MEIKAIINDLSHDGRGIAHINGKITFIRDALPNEEVTVEYIKHHSKRDEAKVVKILRASEDRVKPRCKHFDICGGCVLQHMEPTAQIKYKQKILLNQLQHFGDIKNPNVLEPVIGVTYGYRRKARLSVKYVIKKNKVLVGFHEKNGRYVADLEGCEILDTRIGTKIKDLAALISDLSIYDQIPQIEIALGDLDGALVFRHLAPFTSEDLLKIQSFASQNNLQIYIQPEGPDSAKLINEEIRPLSYKLKDHNLELFFAPTDFVQVNASINEKLVNRVLEFLEPNKNDSVLDLFCGLGNFTLPLARFAKEVVGVEGDSDLINRAQKNASHNNLVNANFYQADLSKENQTAPWHKIKFDKLLLDPPRTGALEIINQIAKFAAKKIVYVSCNPATLARDAKEIIKNGFTLREVGILDMFPHTSHVESIAIFEK